MRALIFPTVDRAGVYRSSGPGGPSGSITLVITAADASTGAQGSGAAGPVDADGARAFVERTIDTITSSVDATVSLTMPPVPGRANDQAVTKSASAAAAEIARAYAQRKLEQARDEARVGGAPGAAVGVADGDAEARMVVHLDWAGLEEHQGNAGIAGAALPASASPSDVAMDPAAWAKLEARVVVAMGSILRRNLGGMRERQNAAALAQSLGIEVYEEDPFEYEDIQYTANARALLASATTTGGGVRAEGTAPGGGSDSAHGEMRGSVRWWYCDCASACHFVCV